MTLKLDYGYNERVRDHKWKREREKWAKDYEGPKPEFGWGSNRDEIDGFVYELVIEDDCHFGPPDDKDMVLGTITEYPERHSSWKIDPDVARGIIHEQRMYSYFEDWPDLWWNPMEEIEELQGYFQKGGASKQVSRELAQAQEKGAMERRLSYGDGWHYVTVWVKVYRNEVELGSANLGGVESDFVDNEEFAEEIVNELAADALAEAWETIDRLIVSARHMGRLVRS